MREFHAFKGVFQGAASAPSSEAAFGPGEMDSSALNVC